MPQHQLAYIYPILLTHLCEKSYNIRRAYNISINCINEPKFFEGVQHLGRVFVAARIFEGGVQFLFQDAKKMAQIVGVGLDFATVFLTRENVIVVEAIGQWEWTRLWENLEENLFESPISKSKIGKCQLSWKRCHLSI
jgi:hypothetical protein